MVSNPKLDNCMACVPGPVPRSRNLPPDRLRDFISFSRSGSKLFSYHGISSTLFSL